MLTSITPLGERGRGSRWGLTFAFMLAGGLAGGALAGALLGAVGAVALGPLDGGDAWRLVALAALVALGVALEGGLLGGRLPSVRRQVDERWLVAYRGWVYGAGFGVQLGAGVATIVSTAAVYATFAAALLSGDAALGALIGGTFGLARAATLAAAAPVKTPDGLLRLGRRLERWAPRARLAALGAQLALAATAALVALHLT